MSETRIGLGCDVHALADGRPLVLGGVELAHERGLAGHSDADVLVHALMDAILGAMRAGDIGQHFPDTDAEWEGASSIGLLTRVGDLMRADGWSLVDADTVLVLDAPRISPHRDAMRARMAAALGVDPARIGLKATTTEGLGVTGRGEGVAAQAVVLLERP
jgi:2-C-methyl-D-erythritol 2,4-cyclodiphosphate synthase